jgi:hypothetical protein
MTLHMLMNNTFFIKDGRAYIKVCDKTVRGKIVTYATDTTNNKQYIFDGDEPITLPCN